MREFTLCCPHEYCQVACEVLCISFSPKLWRMYAETVANERAIEVCASDPKAREAVSSLSAVSTHMNHSERIAKSHYRMKTSKNALAAGKFIDSLLSEPSTSKHHEETSRECPVSTQISEDGTSTDSDKFKESSKKRNKSKAFEKRLN